MNSRWGHPQSCRAGTASDSLNTEPGGRGRGNEASPGKARAWRSKAQPARPGMRPAAPSLCASWATVCWHSALHPLYITGACSLHSQAPLQGVPALPACGAALKPPRPYSHPCAHATSRPLLAQVVRRGAPPLGGGEVLVRLPVIKQLPPVSLTDEGMVKRIRGVAYSARVSPQASNRMVDGARGVLNSVSGLCCARCEHLGPPPQQPPTGRAGMAQLRRRPRPRPLARTSALLCRDLCQTRAALAEPLPADGRAVALACQMASCTDVLARPLAPFPTSPSPHCTPSVPPPPTTTTTTKTPPRPLTFSCWRTSTSSRTT